MKKNLIDFLRDFTDLLENIQNMTRSNTERKDDTASVYLIFAVVFFHKGAFKDI